MYFVAQNAVARKKEGEGVGGLMKFRKKVISKSRPKYTATPYSQEERG
jgi:hypothetical protein